MSRMHGLLVAQYAGHYARINASADPAALPAKVFKGMDAMFGPLLQALPAGAKVLDLGCGTGFLLRWLAAQPGIAAVGVDASPGQLAIAAGRLPHVQLVCRDGLDYLRENPATFAGIFCLDVLEHVPGDDLLLAWVEAAAAALVPGGFFACRVPNAANLTAAHARYIDLTHQRCFTSASVVQLLAAGGLAGCRPLPPRAATWAGRLRLAAETLLHRAVFRLCSCGPERVFARSLCAVGMKPDAQAGALKPDAPAGALKPDAPAREERATFFAGASGFHRPSQGDSPVFAGAKTGTVPRPIRILHVAGRMCRAGAETWLMQVLRHIDRTRFQMDFLVHTDRPCDYDDEIRALGSRIIPCLSPARPWQYARNFRRILREEGPYDAVHAHLHHFSGFALKLAHAAGVPLRIAHSHNDTSPSDALAGPVRRAYLRLCERWIRRHATLRLACSRRAIPSLFGSGTHADRPVTVLHYGLDFRDFHEPLDRAAVRAEWGLPADAFVVGHVGRFVEQKNHALLLEIAAELVRRRPETVLLLLGEGPLRPAVERQAASLGLVARQSSINGFVGATVALSPRGVAVQLPPQHGASNVVFAGVRADVPRLMRGAMDALLMPSRWEGLPLTLIEAQAAGLPCVISEAISDEIDRVPGLVRRMSLSQPAAAWAAAVLESRTGEPSVPQRDALAVLERSSFDIRNCVAYLESLYDHAIARRRAA